MAKLQMPVSQYIKEYETMPKAHKKKRVSRSRDLSAAKMPPGWGAIVPAAKL
jgi:hypothetical protein